MVIFGTKHDKVHVDKPHISSRAAYLLLKYQYEKEMRFQRETFRNNFFDKNEPLICFYCGKTNLVREVSDQSNKKLRDVLATVDHLIALTNGGSEYDESNCVVACYSCNMKKQNKKLGSPEFENFVNSRITQFSYRMTPEHIVKLLNLN